ncbi:Alpha/beta superfamily hydrolase [Fontimonas thermophila]|uniref:Alpha/beta superfamily hydrolase n=1 Tax=Fontimonas thermophila TaxID=1076937 RepID=A0A1I2IRY0_9GAMM|nr:alpha/beta fold hydrolase [Fontimonas thermophila]SFF45059.1 Alpha/beta superfamily hydrolase [Fontimonas thermophila]
MIDSLVCFAHGKESGPWGRKIQRLADVARSRGFEVMSPDYSHTHDPNARVAQLLALRPQARRLVLAGSSMGGYVSAMACADLAPHGLFLMAPALYFPGWDAEPEGIPALCCVIHGWHDEIVPVERALRFAKRHKADLHLLDAEHTLNARIDTIAQIFDDFLARMPS